MCTLLDVEPWQTAVMALSCGFLGAAWHDLFGMKRK